MGLRKADSFVFCGRSNIEEQEVLATLQHAIYLGRGDAAHVSVEFVGGDVGCRDEVIHCGGIGGRVAEVRVGELIDGHLGGNCHGSHIDAFVGGTRGP